MCAPRIEQKGGHGVSAMGLDPLNICTYLIEWPLRLYNIEEKLCGYNDN